MSADAECGALLVGNIGIRPAILVEVGGGVRANTGPIVPGAGSYHLPSYSVALEATVSGGVRPQQTSAGASDAFGDERTEPIEYVESLRRISQSLTSGMDLQGVLQAIVEALCDHTRWQLCWIYAMDTDGGFGEIAARRDRMEYTTQSPKMRWPFGGNPALDALRRNEVFAFPDVREATEYPVFVESAVSRGVVASANVPLSSNDPNGRPMVLCVQSRYPLLSDPSQIPFLRAVASLASLAATNAGLLAEARQVAARASETAALLSSTMDGITAGRPSRELLREIESRTLQTLVVFDGQGHLYYAGTPPREIALVPGDWEAAVLERRAELHELVRDVAEGAAHGPVPVAVPVLDGVAPLSAFVSRFGADERSMTTVVCIVGAVANAGPSHLSVGTATAMVLLRDHLRYEAQTMLQREVISQLLAGDFEDRYELTVRAGFAGIDVDEPRYLVVASIAAGVQEDYAEQILTEVTSCVRRWPHAHHLVLSGRHVLLLPSSRSSDTDARHFVERLASSVTVNGERALVVTSSERPLVLDDYAAAWARCVQTIELADKIERRGVVGLNDFGAYRVLLPALEGKDITEFIDATIGPLLKSDRDSGGDLFATVEAFANMSGKFQETSRHLHIHVSTLRYRLQRAMKLLRRDLADEETRFEISLATRLERLRQRGD